MSRPALRHSIMFVALLAGTPHALLAGEAPPPSGDAGLLAFAAQLRECQVASATQPHPLMRGFTINHAVAGPQGERCGYSQTMPGGMRMVCAFDASTRDAYADELERTASTGAMSGGSKDAKPAWAASCEIETKDGKRLPMG